MLLNKLYFGDKSFKEKLDCMKKISNVFFGCGFFTLAIAVALSNNAIPNKIGDFQEGFYFGVAIGVIIVSMIIKCRIKKILNDDKKFKEEEIKYNDERNRFISDKSAITSFVIIMVSLYISLVISGFLNMIVFATLLSVIAFCAGVFFVVYFIMDKKF